MERNINNIPPYGEEITIEQQTTEELREQIRILQVKNKELEDELKEVEEDNDDLTRAALENLDKERNKSKKLEEQNKKLLEAKNEIEREKDEIINELKVELTKEKEKSQQEKDRADDLQLELNKEKDWWDKWERESFQTTTDSWKKVWGDSHQILRDTEFHKFMKEQLNPKKEKGAKLYYRHSAGYGEITVHGFINVFPNNESFHEMSQTLSCSEIVKCIYKYYRDK